MSDEQWVTKDVAAFLKITVASVRQYRVRDASFPPPDGQLGSTPWWHPGTIKAWHEARPGRTGRPPKHQGRASAEQESEQR